MIGRNNTILVILFCASALCALDLGLGIGGGFTFVNFEKASGYDDDYLRDWGEGHFRIGAQVLFPITERMMMGGEVGYNDLYWYDYRVPYGDSPVYRYAEWSTTSLLGVTRYTVRNLVLLHGGAGLHFFDGSPAFALSAGVGIQPRWKKLTFPVLLRIEPIFGDGTPTPLALQAGIQYRIRDAE